MFKELFIAIQNRIIDRTLKYPTRVEYVDLFNNQFENLTDGQEVPFPFPAIMVQIGQGEFKTLGNRRQDSLLTISLHIGSYVMEDSNSIGDNQSLALQHLELLDLAHRALQGWSPLDGAGPMDRRSLTPDENRGLVVVHIMSYRVRVIDDAAKLVYKTVEPVLKPIIQQPE